MHGPDVQVADAKLSGPSLPVLIGLVVAVGLMGFTLGASLGRSPSASAMASASAVASAPGPITESEVSRELWQAYLSGANSGWAVCAVAAEISCLPVDAQPSKRFADFFALPFHTSARDWDLLDPMTVQPAHYVVAGPITLTEPYLLLARVNNDDVATVLNASPQTQRNGVVWADLGDLDAGRYLVMTQGWAMDQPDAEGRSTATWVGSALAFVVAAPGTAPAVAPGPTGSLSPVQLPSAGGTCAASQIVLGKATYGYGYGTIGTTSVYVTLPLRNVGGGCVLHLPAVIGVGSATRPVQAVMVGDAGTQSATGDTSPANSANIGAGDSLSIVLGASWWIEPLTVNGTVQTQPCRNPISDVTRVKFPLATGTIQVELPVVFKRVCSSPASMAFTIKGE